MWAFTTSACAIPITGGDAGRQSGDRPAAERLARDADPQLQRPGERQLCRHGRPLPAARQRPAERHVCIDDGSGTTLTVVASSLSGCSNLPAPMG